MFGKSKSKNSSPESIRVADFFFALQINHGNTEYGQRILNELPGKRPYEIAGMVVERLKGLDGQNDKEEIERAINEELIMDFDNSFDKYCSKRYKKVSKNDS